MKCDNCNHQKDGACSNHYSPYSGLKTDFDWGCAFFAPRPENAQLLVSFSEDDKGINVNFEMQLGSNKLLNKGAQALAEMVKATMAPYADETEGDK